MATTDIKFDWQQSPSGEECALQSVVLKVGPNPMQPRYMQCWGTVSVNGHLRYMAHDLRDIDTAKRWAEEKARKHLTT